jgi:hypothetical protein
MNENDLKGRKIPGFTKQAFGVRDRTTGKIVSKHATRESASKRADKLNKAANPSGAFGALQYHDVILR